MTILVTGAAGLIGANFVLDWLAKSNEAVLNLDKRIYAGTLESLTNLQGDIGDAELVGQTAACVRK